MHETYDHWSVAVLTVTVHSSFFPTFDFLKICCFLHWIQSVDPHFYVTLYYNGSPYIQRLWTETHQKLKHSANKQFLTQLLSCCLRHSSNILNSGCTIRTMKFLSRDNHFILFYRNCTFYTLSVNYERLKSNFVIPSTLSFELMNSDFFHFVPQHIKCFFLNYYSTLGLGLGSHLAVDI